MLCCTNLRKKQFIDNVSGTKNKFEGSQIILKTLKLLLLHFTLACASVLALFVDSLLLFYGHAEIIKKLLPLKLTDVNYLSESILFELQISDKICNFISLDRSPSQTAANFDSFLVCYKSWVT